MIKNPGGYFVKIILCEAFKKCIILGFVAYIIYGRYILEFRFSWIKLTSH